VSSKQRFANHAAPTAYPALLEDGLQLSISDVIPYSIHFADRGRNGRGFHDDGRSNAGLWSYEVSGW
jgi:hypothetical protein